MNNSEMIASFDKNETTETATFYTTSGTIEVVNHIGVAVEINTIINREIVASDLHVDFPVWEFDFFELGETLVNYYLS